MSLIRKGLEIFRYLSLDVVVGGVLFANSLAHVFNSSLAFSTSFALGCCIWLIYTLDHLIDALGVSHQPNLKRHAVHKEYKVSIFVLFIFVALMGLWQLRYLPHSTLIYGCALLGLVGLYFLTIWVFKIFFAKELFIAALYSCGIFLGVSSQLDISLALVLLFIQTAVLASINLLLFSLNEVNLDEKDGHRSWATHFGIDKSKKHIIQLFVVMGVLLLLGFFQNGIDSLIITLQIIFSVMYLVLFSIHQYPMWFAKNERFRWIGDLIFLFPGLIYLW